MKKVEILKTEPQRTWGWPVTANFVLCGMGTGFYLFSLGVGVLEEGFLAMSKQVPYGLLAPVLVALGFLALASEAGNPSKGFHLFRKLRQAWLSRETFFWSIFLPIAVLDWLIPNLFFRIISVITALALMVSQGFILYQIRAIMGWNVPTIPALFISSGFTSGGGVALLISGLDQSQLSLSSIIIGIIALSVNLVIWFFYLYWSRKTVFCEAIKNLRQPLFLIITVGLGHILPLFLLSILAWLGRVNAGEFFHIVTLTGLAILLGVIFQKKAIVERASKMKAIMIEASKN
jgi:DMSO reductase anchor subunit